MKIVKLGPYRIVKQIGKGGMGAVYEAIVEDASSSQNAASTRVAIKALSPQLALAEGFRERFEAEIESLKKLKHNSIVRLYGYGEQDGVLFYSMELVEGPSLEDELKDARRFDWRETLQIGSQICRALKHAHDHGVVHRDIKPANIMLTSEKRVKIADFGIARLFGGTQLTTAGGVLGTADYMSPEQADGRAVTEKCDQYSLGGVMYALLAGRPPFLATTLPEMLQLQRFAEPEPVRRYAVDTPDQLDRLISQLLSKEPKDRFPNALVLSRHMEAMEKALSRPAQAAADVRQIEDPISPAGPSDLTVGLDQAATCELDASNLPLQDTATEEPPSLFDAPTLEQSSDSIANPVTHATITTPETQSAEIAPKPITHFITVDEDARRQREQEQGSRLAAFAQLASLFTALGLLVWGGWQLMKPPTADELFASINQAVEQEGLSNLSRETIESAHSFFQRFPKDSRNSDLQLVKEQLEFQKAERKARARMRFSGTAKLRPIDQVYFDALSIAKESPTEALSMLESLLTLYDPGNEVTSLQLARNLTEQYEEFGDPKLLFAARQRIEQLTNQLEQQMAAQLPALRGRLARAARLRQIQPQQAEAMYQAIVKLYDGKAWASDAVRQAKTELTSLQNQE